MKLIQKRWNGMQSIHGSKSIHYAHKCVVNMINATMVQNDVIVRRFINSMNMAMDAQYEWVIMQLMVVNMIMMYEYAIKKITTNLLRKCTSSYIMDDMEINATRQA